MGRLLTALAPQLPSWQAAWVSLLGTLWIQVLAMSPSPPPRLQLDYAAVSALAGTKSYSVRVQDSEFIGNQMNVTGAFAAESDFSLSMQVTGTCE